MIIKEFTFQSILIDSCCLRKGILITMTDQYGKRAEAEVSPLPGYSNETIGEALQQLKGIKRRLTTTWWTKQSLHRLSSLGLYPSVYFGVESALLDLLAPLEGTEDCNTYALLFGCHEEIMMRADEVEGEGLKCAKLKLGHFTPEMAHKIVEHLGDRFKLRIDLNRKWSKAETVGFCSRYPHDYFEYIEEPVSDPKDLVDFPYPFALDENLRILGKEPELLASRQLKALAIKPTMTYPVSQFLNLGPKVVLTSSFEGLVGNNQIRKLINRLGLLDTYHGLDTLRYFEKNYEKVPHREMEKASS